MSAIANLNTVAATTAPRETPEDFDIRYTETPYPMNFWPDEAWDSEGNHWVQDETGWHWHCRNQSCSAFTRRENWHGSLL